MAVPHVSYRPAGGSPPAPCPDGMPCDKVSEASSSESPLGRYLPWRPAPPAFGGEPDEPGARSGHADRGCLRSHPRKTTARNDTSLRTNVRLDWSADSASTMLRMADVVVGRPNPSMPKPRSPRPRSGRGLR